MFAGKIRLVASHKMVFGNYHIAYYFIAGQIIKDKRYELNLDELFVPEGSAQSPEEQKNL